MKNKTPVSSKKVKSYIICTITASVVVLIGFALMILLGVLGYPTTIFLIPVVISFIVTIPCFVVAMGCSSAYRIYSYEKMFPKSKQKLLKKPLKIVKINNITREVLEAGLLKEGFEPFFDCFIQERSLFNNTDFFVKFAKCRDIYNEFDEHMQTFVDTTKKAQRSGWAECNILFLCCDFCDKYALDFVVQKNKEFFADQIIKDYYTYRTSINSDSTIIILLDEYAKKMYYVPIHNRYSMSHNEYMRGIL